MSKDVFHAPTVREVIYVLYDFDSGFALGGPTVITVEVFTNWYVEIFCKLKDYLTYKMDMRFEPGEMATCFREVIDDQKMGRCYLAEGSWNGKKFGVLYKVR